MSRARGGRGLGKPPVVLVFGEGANDIELLIALVRALQPTVPKLEARRRPLILQKGRDEARRRKNAADVADLVRRERTRRPVPFVVAHQDCDALEPAHVELSEAIERGLADEDVVAVAVTPAWEVEAWLYQWPDAVHEINRKWRRLTRTGDVGRIEHVKESLIKDLRPKGKVKTRDYEESDSVRIVKKAIELKKFRELRAQSKSYRRFVERLSAVVRDTSE